MRIGDTIGGSAARGRAAAGAMRKRGGHCRPPTFRSIWVALSMDRGAECARDRAVTYVLFVLTTSRSVGRWLVLRGHSGFKARRIFVLSEVLFVAAFDAAERSWVSGSRLGMSARC